MESPYTNNTILTLKSFILLSDASVPMYSQRHRIYGEIEESLSLGWLLVYLLSTKY